MGFAPFGTVVEGMAVVDKIFPGYRESPRQDLIDEQGDAYLKANFPLIDKIKLARILPAAPPPAHAPAGVRPPAQALREPPHSPKALMLSLFIRSRTNPAVYSPGQDIPS